MTAGPVELLLAKLDRVSRSGNGWRAECPSCKGHSQKLAVAEADSGAALLKCFAGCDARAIVESLGLRLTDLFPVRRREFTPEAQRANRLAMREAGLHVALSVLAREAWVVVTAARLVAEAGPLSEADSARLALAMGRIEDCKAVLRDR